MKNSTRITIEFNYENKKYSATFTVTREPAGTSYFMHSEVAGPDGKIIFKKERSDLDYSQVEPALLFVLHQAFAQETV